MFSLMPHRERGLLARNPFAWFNREFAPLFARAFTFPVDEFPAGNLDMEERANEYVVRAMVPGFEASEVEVTLAGDVLTMRAEHRPAANAPSANAPPANAPAGERPLARLERTLTLPPGVNLEAVEARCTNGILEVHVPRIPEAQPRHIAVKA